MGLKMTQIVANRIRTPDGTILQSYHVHDYKTYLDKNGYMYMVDGGNEYLRRTIVDEAPYEELSVMITDPHEDIRAAFNWGTRGKDGKESLRWVALKDLDTNHIQAILDTQPHISDWVRNIMSVEMNYRYALNFS
jgi:hypothetical protein